jgi:CheY-like chemotaxis protein
MDDCSVAESAYVRDAVWTIIGRRECAEAGAWFPVPFQPMPQESPTKPPGLKTAPSHQESRIGDRSAEAVWPERVRIVVIDDHRAIHEAVFDTVRGEEDLELCGTGDSASSAPGLIEEYRPHVVLLDLNLGDRFGVELIGELVNRFPDLRILVFSMFEEAEIGRRALEAGARGYVTKTSPSSTLLEGIRAVAAGQLFRHGRAVDPRKPRLASPFADPS